MHFRQQELDPDVTVIDGNAKARQICDEQGPRILALLQEAKALVKAKASPRDKFDRLTTIAENMSKVITPYTPCGGGCSHCCYMSVAISDIEAEAISRYSGRAMARKGTIDEFLRDADDMVDRYTGVPCTFLVEGKCSIYVVRPIACRTHHNLGPNSDNCIIKDVVNKCSTPKFNIAEIDAAAVEIVMTQANAGFADIREFFP